MTEKLLDARDLHAAYGAKRALSNVSFDLAKGEFLAILGPNGSGKTTLFRLLLGLLAPAAASDALEVLGGPPGAPACLARLGATIEIPSLYGHLSAMNNLHITALLAAFPFRAPRR
jgi:ABC-2 type transport system ATP-binding protein